MEQDVNVNSGKNFRIKTNGKTDSDYDSASHASSNGIELANLKVTDIRYAQNGILKSADQNRSHKKTVFEHLYIKPHVKVSPIDDVSNGQVPSSTSRKSAWEKAQEAQQTPSHRRRGTNDSQDDLLYKEKWFEQRTYKHIFKTKRFKDPKLEKLYQRYFFKLNQYNLTILMGVFCVIAVLLIIFYYISGATLPMRGICLGLILVIFIFLEVLCNRSTFDQKQSSLVCYVISLMLCGFVALIAADNDPRSASDSVWCTVLFIYMTYALLPVRMRLAVLGANSLALIHLIIAIARNHQDSFAWKQVRENTRMKCSRQMFLSFEHFSFYVHK